MKRLVIFTLAALTAIAIAWYGYGVGGESAGLSYSLQPVGRGDVESVVVTTGTLEALNTIVVGSQLSGQLAELHADFNDLVEADQLIARIDPRTFEARVRASRADVKVAQASIQQREAEVVRSEATLAQATRELARRQSLEEKGHISESELDADVTAVETADAQLRIAQATVANAEAVLEQRQAALSQAEVDVERTYIRSPVAGTVINRTVELGQTVAASLQAPELFQIAQDLHQMKVEASVDEADIGRISDGLQVRFSVDAYPDRQFNGRVEQIRKAPDRIQNVVTYRVIIAASNDDLALLPGMTANVEVVLGHKSAVLKVPNAALRYTPRGLSPGSLSPGGPSPGGGGQQSGAGGERGDLLKQEARADRAADRAEGSRAATVWMLDEGLPVARAVRVGLADDDATEIVRGLEEGDEVIVRATRDAS
jgi:HlyD family secretion protein